MTVVAIIGAGLGGLVLAWVLGKDKAAHPEDLDAAFAEYEAKMFRRSAAAAVDAEMILDLCLGDRAPYGLTAFFGA